MREATIHLPDDELDSFGIGEFVSVVRDSGLGSVTELQCSRPGCLLVVEVAEQIPAEDLNALDDLEWWERVDASGGTSYLCKLAVTAFEDGFDPHHETGVSEDCVEVTSDGVEVTMVGPHDDISDRVDQYGDTGADVLLRTLTDYSGREDPLDAVTPRQREVLTTAHDMGYFEVPREVTTDDVAGALDLDPSTVREHLQRAQNNLLTELLNPR